MNNNNKTPDKYQEENERREELTRWLKLYFSDQNWIPDPMSWRRIFLSYDVADREMVAELMREFGRMPRPKRDTHNFGYDSWAEGVED